MALKKMTENELNEVLVSLVELVLKYSPCQSTSIMEAISVNMLFHDMVGRGAKKEEISVLNEYIFNMASGLKTTVTVHETV